MAVTVGNTLTANIATIYDYDNIFAKVNTTGAPTKSLPVAVHRSTTGAWIDIDGATGATYMVPTFVLGTLGMRVKASYVDGKGYTEQLFSASNATAVTVRWRQHGADVDRGNAVQWHLQHDRDWWASLSTSSLRSA